jgi:hypothetical protein
MRRLHHTLIVALTLAACGDQATPGLATTVHVEALLKDEVKHLTLFAYGPQLTNGKFLPCSILLERTLTPVDPLLDQLARTDVDFSDPATRKVTLDGVSPGPNRVVYVEASAGGATLASGCTDGVTVESGQITTVDVMLYRLP